MAQNIAPTSCLPPWARDGPPMQGRQSPRARSRSLPRIPVVLPEYRSRTVPREDEENWVREKIRIINDKIATLKKELNEAEEQLDKIIKRKNKMAESVRVIPRQVLRRSRRWRRVYQRELSSGRIFYYYWNPRTGESSWTVPIILCEIMMLQEWDHNFQAWLDVGPLGFANIRRTDLQQEEI